MRGRKIQVELDEDTLNFLLLSAQGHKPDAVSEFINSLLRQERFRQGYSLAARKVRPFQPIFNWVEHWMLLRSGLLPLARRPRH